MVKGVEGKSEQQWETFQFAHIIEIMTKLFP